MREFIAFYDPRVQLHSPQTYLSRGKMRTPQELPIRTEMLLKGAVSSGLELAAPQDFGLEPLLAVHDTNYLKFLQTAHEQWTALGPDWGEEVISNIYVRHPNNQRNILAMAAAYLADGSCPIGQHTWTASYWAAQCAIAAAHRVLDGDRVAYALCRPPGHHARRDAAGGFCYINNAAAAAEFLARGGKRVAVMDTDVHHGQGIQEIFYNRDDVLYVSIHADPTNFYPVVAGYADERGAGRGYGFNLNLPMPHGSSESVFFEKLDLALQAVRDFKPDYLVHSLGFDIYEQDPQSKVSVTTDGFRRLGSSIEQLGLPTVIVQEGGYHYDSLADNLIAFCNGFVGSMRKR